MALAIPERSASIATPSYGIKTDNVPVVGAMTIRAQSLPLLRRRCALGLTISLASFRRHVAAKRAVSAVTKGLSPLGPLAPTSQTDSIADPICPRGPLLQ